jgi:hypothetical protein
MNPNDYEQLWRELATLLFVPLTRGKFAVIDAGDWQKLPPRSWCAKPATDAPGFYALACVAGKMVRMHRLLANAPANVLVDHHNGDGLDNRQRNLRQATHSQNNANRRAYGKLGIKGVRRSANGTLFISQIKDAGGRMIRLGTFANADDAAVAYDLAALARHGEFARLNYESRRDEFRATLLRSAAV